jgi:hypothetical protein
MRKMHLKVCNKQLGDFGIDYFSKADSMRDMQQTNKYKKLFCNNIEFVENTNKITQ